jgi:RNA polymerase sigma-70 factor (ECF subfamily)
MTDPTGETHHQLRRAIEGDDQAREALLERLRPRLVLWASARMSPALRAKLEPEDAAQEILLAVHKSLHQFTGDEYAKFRAWLFTVAENRIRDLAAHANALKRRTPEPSRRTQTTPSVGAMRTEMAGRLHEALMRLPEDYRRVIQLRRFEELDSAAVAELMDRSPNAVRVLYFRAIRALREEMPEER